MKNLVKISFLVGFLFISTSAIAKDRDFSVSFENVNSKTLTFEVANAENVSLWMYDDSDDELYSEKIENEARVVKSYNMEGLNAGTYYLVAESAQLIRKYKITVDENGVIAAEMPETEIAKPEYIIDGHFVDLKMSDLEEDVHILVQDLADNEYDSETVSPKNGTVRLRFDLNPATADSYVIQVSKGKNTFSKVISLR